MDLSASQAFSENSNKEYIMEIDDSEIGDKLEIVNAESGVVNSAVNLVQSPSKMQISNCAMFEETLSNTDVITTNENNEKHVNIAEKLMSPGLYNKSPLKNADGSPKTLLGKEQIKKRLHSFSLLKQGIQAKPLKKLTKPPKIVRVVGEECYDENGEKFSEKVYIKKPSKKGPNHHEIAKAVINEIEEIKRAEATQISRPYLYPGISPKLGKHSGEKHIRTIRHERSSKEKKRRSSEREGRRNSECIDIKMPETWSSVKEKNVDFDVIRKIKERSLKIDKYDRKSENRDKRSKKSSVPMRKEDLPKTPIMFEYPSTLRHPFVATSAKSEEETKKYPQEIIKFTEKYPPICYCENPDYAQGLLLSRKQALSQVPAERAVFMKDFMDNKIRFDFRIPTRNCMD